MTQTFNGSITDIPGILVGHAQKSEDATGCTVILCEKPATAGVDQRGGAPGTRETDLLKPVNMVEKVNAVLLAGGSAFGLAAATGVVQYLSEKNIGFNSGVKKVPIVPSAVIFDLGIGNPDSFPDHQMGYQACLNAKTDNFSQGNIGAGCGATAGKLLGMQQSTKSGVGTASISLGNGVIVGALIVVNPFGDILDFNGDIIAGLRPLQKWIINIGGNEPFANTLKVMDSVVGRSTLRLMGSQNTVIGVVATNAKLSKTQATKVAQMAQNGIGRRISPSHTQMDGDTLFCLSTNKKVSDVNLVGAYAVKAVEYAIINAVTHATTLHNIPSTEEILLHQVVKEDENG